MVIVVAQEKVAETLDTLRKAGEAVNVVGTLTERDGDGCVLKRLETWI